MNEEDIKYLEMLKDMIDEKYGNGKKYKQAIENLIYKIKKLETDKRNLIEKLEERRKQNNNRYGQAIDSDEFPEMYEYSGQEEEDDYLLSIVKGVENEENKI